MTTAQIDKIAEMMVQQLYINMAAKIDVRPEDIPEIIARDESAQRYAASLLAVGIKTVCATVAA